MLQSFFSFWNHFIKISGGFYVFRGKIVGVMSIKEVNMKVVRSQFKYCLLCCSHFSVFETILSKSQEDSTYFGEKSSVVMSIKEVNMKVVRSQFKYCLLCCSHFSVFETILSKSRRILRISGKNRRNDVNKRSEYESSEVTI